MGTPLLEAFELIAHSKKLALRLDAAAAELAKRPALVDEKAWLETARVRLARACEGIGDLPIRVLQLEELESMRGDRARELQGEVVDALERLHAGIGFAASPRSPLIEALFANAKLPVLRRVEREELERFCADFEKRLASGYAKRMLADETYAVVVPAIQLVRAAFEAWRAAFHYPPIDDEAARALSEELVIVAHRLDLPSRQARLLAQAALLSARELLDEYDLAPKPRRRGAPDPDTHAILEQDPPDPDAPTAEELAELEGLGDDADAGSSADAQAGGADEPAESPARAKPKRSKDKPGRA
ncbi:MAG: hypothetical protein KF894_11145 [Labilithrix sp.]|nr:hypothetical protein [Labilithrix sp.]